MCSCLSLLDVIRVGTLPGCVEHSHRALPDSELNDSDAAFHWLDRAYQIHDGGLIYLKHDKFIANLRADPRYAAMLKKMGLPR
jgi:hypothetical protein